MVLTIAKVLDIVIIYLFKLLTKLAMGVWAASMADSIMEASLATVLAFVAKEFIDVTKFYMEL